MKLFKTTLTIVLLSICAIASAQTKSITIGVVPYGITDTRISKDDIKFIYDFKNIIGGNLGYEAQLKGVTSLTELSYVQGKFDKLELNGTTDLFNPALDKDLMQASLTQYFGFTINRNKRFQMPIYFGLGGSYLKGGAIDNLTFDLAAKVRMKFYFTNKLGIYVGATGRYGLGDKKADSSSNSNKTLNVWQFLGTADAGFLISF